MPTSEAQKQANKRYRENNPEKIAQLKKQWVNNNYEQYRCVIKKHYELHKDDYNAKSCIRLKNKYDAKKEFAVFLKILLD